jgi:hypothetical protein
MYGRLDLALIEWKKCDREALKAGVKAKEVKILAKALQGLISTHFREVTKAISINTSHSQLLESNKKGNSHPDGPEAGQVPTPPVSKSDPKMEGEQVNDKLKKCKENIIK